MIELLVNLTISHCIKGSGSLSEFVGVIAIEMNNEKRNVVKGLFYSSFFSSFKNALTASLCLYANDNKGELHEDI